MNQHEELGRLLPSLGAVLCRSIFEFFAESSLPAILLIAVSFHAVNRFVCSHVHLRLPVAQCTRAIGLVALLAFGLATYFVTDLSYSDDFGQFLSIAFRAYLVFITAEGVAAGIVAIGGGVWWLLHQPFRCLSTVSTFIYRRIPRLPPHTAKPVKPPPPQPPPSLRDHIAQAKQEFEATVQTLHAAGLDADELEVAILDARQKYLRSLHGVLKT